jgi:PAS domain S-box-containing protein
VRVDLRRVVGRSLSIGLLACAVLAVPFAMRYEDHVAVKEERAEADERRIVDLVAQTALREIAGVLADVRYLSDHNELRELLVQDSPETRQRLATEYLSFARHKRHYDQIRIIGADGQEQVRVNARDGAPVIVPAEALQNKRDRYYFVEAMRLGPGAIHVSPLDLNVEHGAIESPRRPTLRVATPLFGAGGDRRGVLVVNYAADRLFARLKALAEATPGDLWLLNSDGYWLIGPAEDEWAFMFPDRRIRTLAARDPTTWGLMESAREGRLATADGVVTFRKIYPLVVDSGESLPARDGAAPADAQRYHWIAATFLAQGLLTAQSEAAARDLLLGYGVLALVVLLAAPVWSYYSLQRRELNRIMASILDNVQDLISYVDTGERFRFTNRAQREALGLGPAAIHGRTLREVLGDAAYGVLRPRLEEVLGGRAASFDARIAYGGDEHDLEIAYMPDRDHGGPLRGFVAVASDVTPLRNAERREREQMLELAHAARLASVGEMATQIAHEVNQPLTAIVTYCAAAGRALTAQPIDIARITEWLEAIGTQAHRVGDTVRRLREFVRKGAATFVLLDLDQVVTDAVRIVQPIADRQGVQVARESSPALPQVFADRVLLTQAVLNLVRNAVEAVCASPPEQRLVRIVTAARGSSVELRVIDSGPGLSADVAGRLFEPFVTTKAGGLGLGLPIARSILDALGGEIGYDAMPGGGACFTLNLPIRTS